MVLELSEVHCETLTYLTPCCPSAKELPLAWTSVYVLRFELVASHVHFSMAPGDIV